MKHRLQTAPDEHQKRRKMSPASDQSGMESPMSELLDQATVGCSDTRHSSSPAGPTIVVHGVEVIEESPGLSAKTPEPTTTHAVFDKVQESASSRQESPKSDSTPGHLQSPVEGSFIPAVSIACTLLVLFEDSKHVEELSVPLHKRESYQEIGRVAEKRAKTLSAPSIGPKELKFSYGNCTIVSNSGTKTRHPLRSPEDWTNVNKAVVAYWNSHAHEPLRLCISRHYFASQERPTGVESFAEVKHYEIDDLMKETWENKEYIPHNVLETVISDETISWIIKENPPKSVPQEQQEAFIHSVQTEGRILLAMCVHARLGVECLKKLLDNGFKDSTLPLDEEFQCHRPCRSKLRKLVQAQGGYWAECFFKGEHKTLNSHAVVPLHFCPRAHGKDDLDREVTEGYGNKFQDPHTKQRAIKAAAKCGSGAHSNVYCVKMNPNHHTLSEDLDSCFALKEFHDKPKDSKSFDRELDMLKELRKFSHPHIVTHLATWTRNERYYMLFPYAECNLREYMLQHRFAETGASWLLGQFRGMADAVKQIHNLSNVEASTSSLSVITSTAGERRTGYHHDIKPENILFKDGMLCISDWGSAKVNTYRTRSYHTKSPIGTLTYEPPEFTSEGETSRPYDLWSLGCVFLELLIWAVFGSTNVETFSDQRDDKRNANSGTGSMKDDAFWQKKGNEYVLRTTVVTQLRLLDNKLEEPSAPPFKEVVGYVRRMLETETHKRIRASELCDLLDRICLAKTTEEAEEESPREESKPAAPRLSIIPAGHHPSSDAMAHGISPPGRGSDPAYAELLNLSPSDMSSRASRHSRNSSGSELLPSNVTRSRQSSNASNRSVLSVRERRGSHSSANSPRATEGGT